MLSTYIEVAQAISDKVKAIIWLELDKGQLDRPDAFNSILAPAVLIGQADIVWSDLMGRNQQGVGTITVKTVLSLTGHTHLTDPTLSAQLKTLELADDVDQAVRQVRGIVSRTSSKEYYAGVFYVVEQTYEGAFQHGPFIRAVPVRPFVNPSIHNPIAQA